MSESLANKGASHKRQQNSQSGRQQSCIPAKPPAGNPSKPSSPAAKSVQQAGKL